MIDIILKDQPRSQKRHRSTRSGHIYDPSSKDKKKTMLQLNQFKPNKPLEGALLVKMIFTFKRPKSHYRTGKHSHLLKTNMPQYYTSTPDADNCAKYYLDCMNKVYYKDDSQVAMLQVEQYYEKNPSVEIIIEEL